MQIKAELSGEKAVVMTALCLAGAIDLRLAAFHASIYALTSIFLPFLFSMLRHYKWSLPSPVLFCPMTDIMCNG